jgi:alkylated DNA repair dioxygenase AlkB
MIHTLFPESTNEPEGFYYLPNFLSVQEESALVKSIQNITLHTFTFQGFEAKRKVASFGFDYSFDHRQLKKGRPIPSAFLPLIRKVSTCLSIVETDFVEVLVTEYPAGSVINWHRDAPPFDIIVGISLEEDCVFKLRPYDKNKQGKKSVVSVPVQRRSLYVLKGEAREAWQHSIAPVKNTRYSITLRTLR